MRNTFTAQAFDAGDPCSGGGQCCENSKDGQGGWPCKSGLAPYTGQFMGGIHPRVKKIVGIRLAKAAQALVYGDSDTVWTGPVIQGCAVNGNTILLSFDREKLKQDAIMVLDGTTQAIPLGGLGALAKNITGVRYAWGENPCCPSFNRMVVPCPPNSCPIQTFNSTLPAVPFWASIKDGKCDWISTQQGKGVQRDRDPLVI